MESKVIKYHNDKEYTWHLLFHRWNICIHLYEFFTHKTEHYCCYNNNKNSQRKMGKSIIFPFAIVGRSFVIWYNFFKVEKAFAAEQFIFEFVHWHYFYPLFVFLFFNSHSQINSTNNLRYKKIKFT